MRGSTSDEGELQQEKAVRVYMVLIAQWKKLELCEANGCVSAFIPLFGGKFWSLL